MKRWLIIGAGALSVVASLAGAATYFLFRTPAQDLTSEGTTGKPPKKTTREGTSADGDIHVADLMRALATAQDAVAYGTREAIADQVRITAELGDAFRALRAKDWNLYRNFRTALVYVLSGGGPDVIARALDDNASISAADENLARGIVSFASGEVKAARAAFAEIDPRSLDVALIGPFALARASLYLEKDPARAIKLLDDARLACPHTAIEEAAIRREIPLLVSQGAMDRAKLLVTDYVRRFGKSLYAPKLFREFADEIAKNRDLDSAALADELAERMQPADPAATGRFFISLAAESLPHGQLALARAAASQVLKPGRGVGEDVIRAKLYIAAADAPSAQSAEALAVLREMGEESLSGEDAGIKEVAQFVARVISGEQSPYGKLPQGHSKSGARPPPFVPQVASALADADGTVKEAERLISESNR